MEGRKTSMTQGCFWGPQNDGIIEGGNRILSAGTFETP